VRNSTGQSVKRCLSYDDLSSEDLSTLDEFMLLHEIIPFLDVAKVVGLGALNVASKYFKGIMVTLGIGLTNQLHVRNVLDPCLKLNTTWTFSSLAVVFEYNDLLLFNNVCSLLLAQRDMDATSTINFFNLRNITKNGFNLRLKKNRSEAYPFRRLSSASRRICIHLLYDQLALFGFDGCIYPNFIVRHWCAHQLTHTSTYLC
jgi:hypothetical protein